MLGSVENILFNRDDSCFLSFSGHNEFVFVPIDVIEFQIAELTDAHTCVGEEIDDGFGSFPSFTSIAAAENEVDVLCGWCFDGFFVGSVCDEGVVDAAEFAP